MRKVRGRNKLIKERPYFVKWKGCTEGKTSWKPTEGRHDAQDEVQRFHRKGLEMPGSGEFV